MVSSQRWSDSDHLGRVSAQRFVDACAAIGYQCRQSTRHEDINYHIDYWVMRPGGQTSVDVKGNNYPGEIWVEFINVRGKDGWLFGQAEYIAFDIEAIHGLAMVSRTELLALCERLVAKEFVPKHEAYHKLYNREGRQDVISRLELIDIAPLKTFKILNYAHPQP